MDTTSEDNIESETNNNNSDHPDVLAPTTSEARASATKDGHVVENVLGVNDTGNNVSATKVGHVEEHVFCAYDDDNDTIPKTDTSSGHIITL